MTRQKTEETNLHVDSGAGHSNGKGRHTTFTEEAIPAEPATTSERLAAARIEVGRFIGLRNLALQENDVDAADLCCEQIVGLHEQIAALEAKEHAEAELAALVASAQERIVGAEARARRKHAAPELRVRWEQAK